MKIIKHHFSLCMCLLILTVSARAQRQSGLDSTGLPGDNFSLQGALQMFKNAASPEDFEKAINTEGNYVNNLDLNGDGDIDYIKVMEKADKDAHVFILQVAISSTENQDIAVVELEKTDDEKAVIQIVGDEDIYGEQIIVEPGSDEMEGAFMQHTGNSNLSGPNTAFATEEDRVIVVVNVWLWPSVRFVFAPAYQTWKSPWRWQHYPGWWKSWRPFSWQAWHPFRVHHHRPFVITHTHRVGHAHKIYTPYRSSSVIVRNRHSASVNNYRVTRTKTHVTGPGGKTTTIKKTTVKGPRGGKATKVRVRRH